MLWMTVVEVSLNRPWFLSFSTRAIYSRKFIIKRNDKTHKNIAQKHLCCFTNKSSLASCVDTTGVLAHPLRLEEAFRAPLRT